MEISPQLFSSRYDFFVWVFISFFFLGMSLKFGTINKPTTSFPQQTIRELFDLSEGERKDAESSVPQSDEDESINKQQTTILEQVINIFFT